MKANMRVDLVCSDNTRPILVELLSGRNIDIDKMSNICIVETGCPVPEDKLCVLFQMNNIFLLMEVLNKLAKANEDNNKIIGRSGDDRYSIISFDQIYYFEGRGNYSFCITHDGEYRVKEKLYELEETLPHDKFIRVGKSFIANIVNVKEIIPWFNRRLILKFSDNKSEIEVSKNYVKGFREFLGL